ncbi:hypothetical protein TNCV_2636001 [Trichonephila clavipes]|nr:hypothetical protein TNCV_2636001 [Trichonephila clavipes]
MSRYSQRWMNGCKHLGKCMVVANKVNQDGLIKKVPSDLIWSVQQGESRWVDKNVPSDLIWGVQQDKSNDTANEDKPLEPMNKSNEAKPLEHWDGEQCHEVVYKSLEHYPTESLDELLDYVDKPMVENTSKEFIVETMERLDEAMECSDLESMEEVMKCSDPDIVAMECCEEWLGNVETILEEKATELENVEVDKKEENVEMVQQEKTTT